MTTILKVKTPLAKKTHMCDWCFTVVKIGEEYTRTTMVTDWGLRDWVSCGPCQVLCGAVWAWGGHGDEGVGPDEYQEFCQEHLDDPEHGPAATAYLARRTRAAGGGC